MNGWRQAWQRWQNHRACNRLRRELVFWGIDTSELTDEEIAARLAQLVPLIKEMGMTAAEASYALQRLSIAVQGVNVGA